MIEFDRFRVSGWLDEDGLLKKFSVVVSDVVAGVKRVGKTASKLVAVGAFCAAAGITPVQASANGVAWPPSFKAQEEALAGESADARIMRLDATMAESIDRFMSLDQSDLDPRLIAATDEFLKSVNHPRFAS